MSTPTRSPSSALLLLGALCCASLGCDAESEPYDVDEDLDDTERLTGFGVPVTSEPKAITSGLYREVVSVPGCTGTVIGPHAVLTAAHCPGSGNVSWLSSGVSLPGTSSLASPYIDPDYQPAWWVALNEQQIAAGIRDDDWPAQHDQRVFFVPSLDADFLSNRLRLNDFRPARIDAEAFTNRMRAVGNSNATFRRFADVDFVPAPPNDISTFNSVGYAPRDGYFSHATSLRADPGDSGGPVLGSALYDRGPSLPDMEGRRHVISTRQNGYDTAPLAYENGEDLTTNQIRTVSLNQLWVRAASSDADQDNLPFECDPDPSAVNPASASLCPPALGSFDDVTVPRALLQCEDGYSVTGIHGRAGWLIDELRVRCTPNSCLQTEQGCGSEYWTEPFGGEGGGGVAYDEVCAPGQSVMFVQSRDTPGSSVNEMTLMCTDHRSWTDDHVFSGSTVFGTVGNARGTRSDGTRLLNSVCADHGVVVGFEARSNLTGSNSRRWLTGLQPICSGPIAESDFFGGTDYLAERVSCPEGSIAVGVTGAESIVADHVGILGLVCMDEAAVASGVVPSNSRLTVAHSTGSDAEGSYPSLSQDFDAYTAKAPANVHTAICSAGQRLDSMLIYQHDDQLDGVWNARCRNYDGSGSVTSLPTQLGQTPANAYSLGCGGAAVTGLQVHASWFVEGLGLECAL